MDVLIRGVDIEYFQEDIVGEYVDCHLAYYTRLVERSHSYCTKDIRRPQSPVSPLSCTEYPPITGSRDGPLIRADDPGMSGSNDGAMLAVNVGTLRRMSFREKLCEV
jgi:hypothetical protein